MIWDHEGNIIEVVVEPNPFEQKICTSQNWFICPGRGKHKLVFQTTYSSHPWKSWSEIFQKKTKKWFEFIYHKKKCESYCLCLNATPLVIYLFLRLKGGWNHPNCCINFQIIPSPSCKMNKHMERHQITIHPDAKIYNNNPTNNYQPLASYSQRRYQSSPQGSMGRFKPRSSWMAWTIFKRWSKVSKSSSARAASYHATRNMCVSFGKKTSGCLVASNPTAGL